MTRIIYDTAGVKICEVDGTQYTPNGVPYIDVEVPSGKYVASVDVSVTPNVAVFADISKSELQILKETVDALILASLEG
jgi:hypothetical protein